MCCGLLYTATGGLSYFEAEREGEGNRRRGSLRLDGYHLTPFPGMTASQLYLSCFAVDDSVPRKDLLLDFNLGPETEGGGRASRSICLRRSYGPKRCETTSALLAD